ncbi:YdcF family protein [Tepidamorphus sp. 3E244]|uniref:YdcF family protein n=1 Tax=Tepidamorphus sp. 3E244 TaxID=3385498 RepID=UPI0038FC6BF7
MSQSWLRRIATALCAVVIGLSVGFLIGLFHFAGQVSAMSERAAPTVPADGIVVLTGGQERITDAVDLLGRDMGRRLLISGVNPHTTPGDIARTIDAPKNLFNCCVDFGYSALNTLGNAVETGRWVRANSFESLIVVTSGYHMPRTLVELSRETNGTRLVPYPVFPADTDFSDWWRNREKATVMTKEYVKYILSLVRIRLRAPNADGYRILATASL